MSRATRYVVAMLGARDSYQVPIAFAESGELERLVTDFYASDWMARRVAILRRRWRPQLPSRATASRALALNVIQAMARRRDGSAVSAQLRRDAALGRMAAEVAAAAGCGLLAYSYHWRGATQSRAFAKLRSKVVFQVHPVASHVCRILEKDREISGVPFGLDWEERWPEDEKRSFDASLLASDAVIASSEFTRSGLVAAGVAPEKVRVVPYGVDLSPRGRGGTPHSGPLKLLFVGQMVQRKGVHHLLDAVRSFPAGTLELRMVCRGYRDPVLEKMLPAHGVSVMDALGPDDLSLLYEQSDLFVMPSLVEGFGLVYLESMARGLPVVYTANTGAMDIVRHGEEGLLVEAGSSAALSREIAWALDNRPALARMGECARVTAERYRWDTFRRRIRDAVAFPETR